MAAVEPRHNAGITSMKAMLRWALILAGLGALAGCGQPGTITAVPAAEITPTVSEPTATSTWPGEPMPVPLPPDCTGHAGLLTSFGTVEPALGHRYLRVIVLNCTADSYELSAPFIAGVDASGTALDLSVQFAGGPFTLPQNGRGYLHLHWLSNGRCERGVQELRVQLGEYLFAHRDGCFQLGGEYAPDREADIDAKFSLEPSP